MSDGSTQSPGGTPEPGLDEVRQERDRLAAEVDRLKDRPRIISRRRRITALILVILTFVMTSAAIPGVWTRRTLLNTDRYVATVDELALQPAIQVAIADEITVAIFDALDVEQRLADVIGDRQPALTFLAGPISDAVEGFVEEQVLKVVQSPAFQTFWSEANRFLHDQVIAVLEGDSGVIQLQGDQVVLNYLPLINTVLAELSTVLTDLLGRPITLPEITQDTVPADAVTMLESALGIDLPDTFGQTVIYEGGDLEAVQQAFRVTNAVVFGVIVLLLLFAALALWLTPTKRRTLLQLATGILIITVIERRLAIASTNALVADVPEAFRAAAQQAADVLLGSLLQATMWVLIVMLVTIVAAVLSGPYPWVVSLRSWVTGLARGTAGAVRGADAGPAAAWLAAHREGVMIGIAGVAIVIWLFAELSFGGLFLLLIVAVAAEFVAWKAGPGGSDEVAEPPAS